MLIVAPAGTQDGAGSKGRRHFNIKRALIPDRRRPPQLFGRVSSAAHFHHLACALQTLNKGGHRTRLSVVLSLLSWLEPAPLTQPPEWRKISDAVFGVRAQGGRSL